MAKRDCCGVIRLVAVCGWSWFIDLTWDKYATVEGNRGYASRKGAMRGARRVAARLGIRIEKPD